MADKVNAAIIANEPSSRVIFNEKRIATAIEIPAECKNTATCEIAEDIMSYISNFDYYILASDGLGWV